MGIRVGIDLGTTFSAIAKINEVSGKPEIIKNSFNSSITPSVLCFEKNGNIFFGEEAKEMQGSGNTNTIAFFKRNIGNDHFCVEFFGKKYNATDLSAIFLKNLVKEAEKCCGEKIDSAVITVPAYFTHKERRATIEAGKKAGLEVLSIINEPTAAAFAYGLKEKEDEKTVLIYDLGGGTFDVTIARIDKNKIDILGSDGNHELGGKDWDDCIARYLAQQFYEEHGIDLGKSEEMMISLLVIAETVKKKLTSLDKVIVPVIYENNRSDIIITEELFEDISDTLIDLTKDLTDDLIKSIGLSWSDITGVILVGGSTRMRMVHNYVKKMSGKEPLFGINVDEAVALGAAIRANINDLGESITPTIRGIVGNKKNLNVIGAKRISDVTAHALGMIAVSEDGERYENSVIIPKNTSIPSEMKRSYKFRTRTGENELEVYVLQGAYIRPLDNMVLDKYTVTKIEKTSQDFSEIEISYRYTSNGVVEVSAVQKDTEKVLPIRIEKVPEDMNWTDGSPKDQVIDGVPPEVEIILAIDLSGSMSGEPLKKAQEAMREFVKELDANYTTIGLLAFADFSKMIIKPTKNFEKIIHGINNIKVGDVGICNEAEPFTDAFNEMKMIKFFKNKEKIRYLIVLTDGVWDNPKFAIKKAKNCHKEGIEVMALGFGTADEYFLKQIASTEKFASLTNLSELTGSFSKIAQVIGNNTGSLRLKKI